MQHDFILLDRSSSMATMWGEAVASVNAYVRKLAEDKVDTGVTLAVFDSSHSGSLDFSVLRDRIIPSTWKDIAGEEAPPRGSTPLNDATGRIVALANGGGYDKVAIIIMTDGQENSSKELTVMQAKALLDECRAKNWQVIFLGANFDNAAQAASYGNAAHNTAQVAPGNLKAALAATASMRSAYATTGKSMDYSAEDKARLASTNS